MLAAAGLLVLMAFRRRSAGRAAAASGGAVVAVDAESGSTAIVEQIAVPTDLAEPACLAEHLDRDVARQAGQHGQHGRGAGRAAAAD